MKLGLAVLIASAFSPSWTSADWICNGTLTLATSDGGTNPGQPCGNDYTATHVSDDVDQCLQEATSNGASHLSHTWEFDNVPAGAQSLVFEGHRFTSDGETFKFSSAWIDPVTGVHFVLFPGAVISNNFELQGGFKVSMGITSDDSYEWYVYIKDTAGGSSNDPVYIDYLAICTEPGD
jgi:hypothetical protein